MKNVKMIIPLFLIMIISACGVGKWNNFNKQKFTKLKTIKVDDKTVENEGIDNLSFSEDEVLNENYKSNENKSPNLKNDLLDDISSGISPNNDGGIKESDSLAEKIIRAIDDKYVFIVEVNGRRYRLDSPDYDRDGKILRGNLISTQNIKKREKSKIDLKVNEYDIVQMNQVYIELDQIELISTFPKIQLSEPEPIIEENKTETINTIDKRKPNSSVLGSLMLIIGLIVLLVGAGLVSAVFVVTGLLIFILGIGISIKRTKSDAGYTKTIKKEKQNSGVAKTIMGVASGCLGVLAIVIIIALLLIIL